MLWKGLAPTAVSTLVLCAGCASLGPPDTPPAGEAGWTAAVPRCPCQQPPAGRVGDGWAVDRPSSLGRHAGASICFRSYPPVRTTEGLSGQQCCYDANGDLVVSGSGAGTPDRSSSCGGERQDGTMKIRLSGFVAHVVKDVRPWSRGMTWRRIHRAWPPDNRNGCGEKDLAALDAGALAAEADVAGGTL